MIDDKTRARALASVKGLDKEFEAGWNADEPSTPTPTMPSENSAASTGDDYSSAWEESEGSGTVSVPVLAEKIVVAEISSTTKPLSFKETFAARRAAGDKTFEWQGKKYTTDLKKSATAGAAKPPAAVAPAPATSPKLPGASTATYKPSAPVSTPELVRSAPIKSTPSRGNAKPEIPGRLVAMPKLPDEQPPEMFNMPGKTILANGHMPERAPVVDNTPRRGYRSN